MKRLVSLILALIMVFALAACGSSATPTAAPAADNSAASTDGAAERTTTWAVRLQTAQVILISFPK